MLKFKDPPTDDVRIEKLRRNPGHWVLFDGKRKTPNAARCRGSELRRKFRGVEFRVVQCEIYARVREQHAEMPTLQTQTRH